MTSVQATPCGREIRMRPRRSALAALLTGALGAAQAADGTVTITGSLAATTCSVKTPSVTVQLPTGVATGSLAKPGDRAGLTTFNIELTGCYGYSGITPKFDQASANITSGGRLANAGTATNVEIELASADGTVPLNLKLGDYAVKADIVNGAGKATFGAQYYSLGGATAGSAITTIGFTLLYQ